jgi:hypothetical protein
MGVDCRIRLPDNVRLRDVVSVLGVAVGYQPLRRDFSCSSGWSTEVDGVDTERVEHSPEMVKLTFEHRYVPFFFEPDTFRGRLLMPTSTAFWCLVGHRLVDFFGGAVDYNDCDSTEWNYTKRDKPDNQNKPNDGDPWYSLQRRILAVEPITKAELEAFKGAAYDFASDENAYAFDGDGGMVRGRWVPVEKAA